MTGYFKTFAKAADKLLARCKRLKLVAVNDGVVTFVLLYLCGTIWID